MTERYDQFEANPCNRLVLLESINRMMTCAPHICPREVDCFIVARELKQRLDEVKHIESAGDPLVDAICVEFQEHSRNGQLEYGQKMTREDLSLYDWLHHMKEELMDSVLYAEASLRRLALVEDDGK